MLCSFSVSCWLLLSAGVDEDASESKGSWDGRESEWRDEDMTAKSSSVVSS